MSVAHSFLGSNILSREKYCPESLCFAVGSIDDALTNPRIYTQNGKASIYGTKVDSTIKHKLSQITDYRYTTEYKDYSDELDIDVDTICENIINKLDDYKCVRMDKHFELTHLFESVPNVKMSRTIFKEREINIPDRKIAIFKGDINKEFTLTANPDFAGINKDKFVIIDIKTNMFEDIDFEIQIKTSLLGAYYDNYNHNRIINNYIGIIYNVETGEIKEYKYNIIQLLTFEHQEIIPLLTKISELIPYNNYSDIFENRAKKPICDHCRNKYCKNSYAYEERKVI